MANDWNQSIIDGIQGERRRGRRSVRRLADPHLALDRGQERPGTVIPLVYRPEGDDLVVFASKGGAPTNPDWLHNLRAPPRGERRGGHRDQAGRGPRGGGRRTRAHLGSAQAGVSRLRRKYEAKTDRVIPVGDLEPAV